MEKTAQESGRRTGLDFAFDLRGYGILSTQRRYMLYMYIKTECSTPD